jgi:antitoxin MazE
VNAIVQIGNSKGIRVPKMLLEHTQLPDEVELQAEQGRLIVRAARRARAGWAEGGETNAGARRGSTARCAHREPL